MVADQAIIAQEWTSRTRLPRKKNKPRECREPEELLNLPKQVGAALVARENPGRTWTLLGRQTLAPGTEVLAQSFKDRTHTAGQVVVPTWMIAQGRGACNGEASEEADKGWTCSGRLPRLALLARG